MSGGRGEEGAFLLWRSSCCGAFLISCVVLNVRSSLMWTPTWICSPSQLQPPEYIVVDYVSSPLFCLCWGWASSHCGVIHEPQEDVAQVGGSSAVGVEVGSEDASLWASVGDDAGWRSVTDPDRLGLPVRKSTSQLETWGTDQSVEFVGEDGAVVS